MTRRLDSAHRDLRRRRLIKRLAWLVTIATFVFLAWGFVWEPGRLVQRDYTIALPHWPAQCDGLRVDVVADLHTGSPRNGVDKLDRVVAQLSASDSDVVILAGDYVILKVFLGRYVTPEVVAAPEAGILMPERTPQGIVDAVHMLRSQYPAHEATRRYAEGFSWDDTTNGQITLFKQILNGGKP